MRHLSILLVFFVSAAFSLDLESIQRDSPLRRNYYNPVMDKRKVYMPSHINVAEERGSDALPSAYSNSQQYYRRVQELLANLISQGNRNDPNWLENLRQREMNRRQMLDIRPPYDQDDFPAYSQMAQEDLVRWARPAPQLVQPSDADEKRVVAAVYRNHKQLPFSTRVPQEDVMKKRSVSDNKLVEMNDKKQGGSVPRIPSGGSNEKKLSNGNTGSHQVNASAENKMSPDQFQKWLTEEYYRNMAMSFATMRKKRSIADHVDVVPMTRDNNVAYEKLQNIEDSLMRESFRDFLQEMSTRRTAKQNPRDLEEVEVAQDLELLKKTLQALVADGAKLKATYDAEMMSALKNAANKETVAENFSDDPAECPELRLLTSDCAALRGMFPPDPVRNRFIMSCNWHEVCYTCGAQHRISADQCDKSFLQDMKFLCGQLGSCNPSLTSLLLTPLHKKRMYSKQMASPMCEKSCVLNFLARI